MGVDCLHIFGIDEGLRPSVMVEPPCISLLSALKVEIRQSGLQMLDCTLAR